MTAFAQSDATTTLLSYRYYYGGFGVLFVDVTSVDGVCTFEAVSSTGNGAARWTGTIDPPVFAKLMDGVKALIAARDPAHLAPTEGKRFYFETTVRKKDGSNTDKYVVSEAEATESVRALAKLLYDSVVHRKGQ